MGNCDVCNGYVTWAEGTSYTADEFRTIVRMGFEPPASLAMLGSAAVQGWKTGLVANSTTGWLLCPSCARQAARYLPKAAGSGPAGQILYETMLTETLLGVHATQPANTATQVAPAPPAKPAVHTVRTPTKLCTNCLEDIPAEATTCPICHSSYEVTFKGYCCTERAVTACDAQGKCLKCGQPVLDRAVESRLLEAGEAIAIGTGQAAEMETEPEVEYSAVGASVVAAKAISSDSDETKKCPECGETIKLEAKVCRFCKARFEVVEKGYCPNCHKQVEVNEQGRCPTCQGELVDRRVSSTLIEEVIAPVAVMTAAVADVGEESTAQDGAIGQPVRWWQLYLSPNGRIGRFSFFVKGILPLLGVNVLIIVVLSLALAPTSTTETALGFPDAIMPVFALIGLLTFWAWLMLIVKRFHDLNRSGWNILLWVIPFVGQFIYLINLIECFFVKGRNFSTRFGPATDMGPHRRA